MISSLQKELATEKLQHASARTKDNNTFAVTKALEDKLQNSQTEIGEVKAELAAASEGR